jgi:hypothetical protein
MTAPSDQSTLADYVMHDLHSPNTSTSVEVPDKAARKQFRALVSKRNKEKGYIIFSKFKRPLLTFWRVE